MGGADATGSGRTGPFEAVGPDDPAWAKHDFYMRLAGVVESGAKCLGSRVGAVGVRDDRVLGMGYNGTPTGFPNCTERERGCVRCALRLDETRGDDLRGKLYDICLCVHAEENVLATAARFGVPLADAWMYTTLQPCFGCLKSMMQLRLRGIVFLRPWTAGHPEYGWVEEEYRRLAAHFRERGGVFVRLETGRALEPVAVAIGGPTA